MNSFIAWINAPITSGAMTPKKWFAFIGLLMAIIMFWSVVLRTMAGRA